MNKGANKIALGIALTLFLSTVSYAAAPAAPPPVAPTTLPSGGQVKQGSATITTTTNTNNNTATMDVKQDTNRVVINWQSFNVGSQSTVNFRQPSVSSIALNRVIANDGMMSQIYGHINANGNVILINPNGIMFGNGSQVNVAGIVASTADINISDADFVAGKNWGYKQSNTTNGNITIQGSIIAETNGVQMDILGLERQKVNTVSVLNNKILLIADGDIHLQDKINTGTVEAPVMTATNLNLEARTITTATSGLGGTVGAEGFEVGSGSSYTAYSGITMRSDANSDDLGTVILETSNAKAINTSNINIYYNPKSSAVSVDNSAYGVAYNQKDYTNYAAEDADYKSKINYAYTEKVTGKDGVNVEQGTWATGKNTYMLVNNIQQLQDISAASTGNLSGHYALGTHIDASATAKWNDGAGLTPIGNNDNAFSGKFVGDGGIATYWINDLTIINKGDNIGLFGVTKNAALEQVDMARANIQGNNNVGAVVGTMNDGYLYGSVIYGSVSGQQNVGVLAGNIQNNATAIYNINVANVSGQQNVGGIIGNIEKSNIVGNVNYGPVTNTSTGNNIGNTGGIVGRMVDTTLSGAQNYDAVTSKDAQNTGGIAGYMGGNSRIDGMAVNNGQISGTDNVGGLVGQMDGGKIDTAYNTNEQNTLNTFISSVDAPKSTYGQVSGTGSNVGGLVGQMNTGSINNAYNAGNVSGKENVGGLVGSMTGGSISNSYNADNNTVFVDASVGNVNNPNTANYYGFRDTNGTQYYYQRVDKTTTVTMADGKELTMAPGDVIYYTLDNGNKQYVYYRDLPAAADRINNVRLAYRDANISGANNVGGAVGSMSGGSVDSIYNAGTVTLTNGSDGAVGGLIGSKSGGDSTTVRSSFNIAKDATGVNQMSGQGNAVGKDDNSASTEIKTISLQEGRKLNNDNTIFGTQLSDNGTWSIGQDQTLPLLQQGYMSKAGIKRIVEYNGVVNNLMTDDVANLYGDAEFLAGSGDGRNVYNGDPSSITNKEYPQSTVYHYNSSNIWSPQHGYYLSDNSTLIITPKTLTIDVSGSKTYGDSALSGYTYDNTQIGKGAYTVTGSGFVSGESFDTLKMDALTYNGNAGEKLQNDQDSSRLNAGSYDMGAGLGGITANNNNYQINYTGGLTVNKAQLVVTAGTDTKTYDGTVASTGGVITVAGLKNDDKATNFTQQYTNKNVAGTGGSTLAVVDSGYNIYKDGNSSVDGSGNYTVSYVDASGTINKANVTVGGSRAYDGTTNANAGTFKVNSGLVAGEQLGFSGSTTIASANVDYYQDPNNQTLNSWSGLSLANGSNGGLASNYQIVGASYAVTPKALTINVTGSKTYGDNAISGYKYGSTQVGSGAYTVSGSGFVNGESFETLNMSGLAYNGTTGAGLQNNQDNNRLNAGSYSMNSGLSGVTANHGNYQVAYTGSLNVNKAPLTVTAGTDTKTYDGTVASTGGTITVSGLKNSDTAGNFTQQFTNKNVAGTGGSTLQIVNSGYNIYKDGDSSVDGKGNYEVSYATASGTINKASVTVSGTRAYDSTTTANASTFRVNSGLVGSEQLGFSGSTTIASPNVDYYQDSDKRTMNNWTGLSLANGSNGGLASNYQIIGASYIVTPKNLTLNVAGSKTYGDNGLSGYRYGSTQVGAGNYVVTASGFAGADSFSTLSMENLAYQGASGSDLKYAVDNNNLNAGTYTLSSAGFSGVVANHGNYSIGYTGRLTVNKAPLTITANTYTKTYDGTVSSTATPTVSGLKNSDTVTNLTEQFADKNVLGTGGSTLQVVRTGYKVNKNANSSVDGSGNYTVSYVDNTGTINKANITVSGNRVYDGTTTANASTFSVTSGLVGSEQLGFSGSTTLPSANVDYYQSNSALSSWSGLALANGANGGLAGNYQINAASYSITPKSLTLTVSGSKTYGDAAVTGVTKTGGAGYAVSGTGFVNNETISVVNISGMAYKGNAGANFQSDQDSNNLNAGAYTLAGSNMNGATADHGNYNISYANGNLTVNKAPLTITAATDTKTYDGTTRSTAAPIVTGLKNSDTVTNLTEQFTDKNVRGTDGSTLQVVQSGYNVNKNANSSVDGSGNYTVTFADNTGTINKANISVSGTKGYDGNTATTAGDFRITGGLVANEQLGLTGNTNLASPNVDYYQNNPNMATWNGLALADGANGGLAGNYNITAAQYKITPQNITLTVTGTKTYGDAALTGVTNTGGAGYAVSGTGFVNNETISVVNISGMAYKVNAGANFQSDQDSNNLNAGAYTLAGSNMSGAVADHGNYNISYANGNLTVNKAPLTITAATDTKTYDGTTRSTAAPIVTGLKNSDTVTNLTEQFTDKNVRGADGSTLKVVQSGYNVNKNANSSVDGSGNYTVTFADNTGTINKANISVSGTKGYDGNTATTAGDFRITGGLVANEQLGLTGNTTLASPNVDYYQNNPNMATWNGLALADGANGGLAGNYNITAAQYKITPQNITLTVTGTKTYGDAAVTGVTNTGGAGYNVTGTGFVNNETISVVNVGNMAYKGNSGANFKSDQDSSNLNAGAYTLAGSGMSGAVADHGNYNISYTDGSLTVNKAALTITAATDTKTYDGTTRSTAAPIVTGLKNSDTVTNLTEQFTDKNVRGADGSTLKVVQSGYNVNKNANSSVDGSGNYTVTFADNTGTINKANISVSGTKGYDGNTATTAGDFRITGGLVANEQLGLTGNTTLASPNVDYYQNNPNMANWNGLALADGANGGLAGNYNITAAQYKITPQNITLTVTGTKTYGDAALTGVTNTGGAGYAVSGTGFVNNETISVVNVGGMAYKGNSGSNFKSDQDSSNLNAGAYTLAGSNMSGAVADHGNYNISYTDGSLTVNKAALTITAATDTKTYDGTVSSSANAIVTGLKNSDTVTNLTQQFTDKNVRGTDGSTLQVVQSGYNVNKNANSSVDGSGNYTVTFADNTGTINKANISVSGTKGYDGNTATTAGDFRITGGLVANEQLGLTGNTTLASPNVDYYQNNPNMATWNGLALADGANGGLAGNYNITAAQYSITPKALTINVSGSNKYDRAAVDGFVIGPTTVGNTYQVTADGLVNGETLAAVTNVNTAWAQNGYKFSGDGIQNTNVGNYKYAPSGISASHGNYSIQYTGSFDVVPNTFYYVADSKIAMQGMPPGPYSGKIVDEAGNVVTAAMLNNGSGAFVSNAVQGSAVGTYRIYGAGTQLDANGKLIWVGTNYIIEQVAGNDTALRIIPNTTYQDAISASYGGYIERGSSSSIRFIHIQDSGINTMMVPKRVIAKPVASGVSIEEADPN